MKAAVIYQKGDMPRYAEVPDPIIKSDGEMLMIVKAAAIKHVDKAKASGKHYSSESALGDYTVIGSDGVGLLEDGTRVFAFGKHGMIAEKAIIEKSRMIQLPPGIDDVTAAALPNAVAGSAIALRFRAGIQPGETVLINGATGFTGKIAVQVAKHYGAKKIIVTGRNSETLQSLLALGANEIISINQDDETFISQLQDIHASTPVDIVIDYLWGHTAELIFASFKGNGSFTHKVRYVSIGAMSGDKIQFSAENLRSVDLQVSGSGLGSWTKDEMQQLFSEIIPEMFRLAAANSLKVDTETISLSGIEKLWNLEVAGGKRLVITM